ncbi:MAG: hypothetical protein ACYC8T_03300 [Myxococcaceae bacterium]
MGERHSRLAALLAAAWEAEVVSGRELAALAHRATELSAKARLLVLSAYCRAHASRLLARLSTLGRGPLPVPPEEPTAREEEPEECFARLAARAKVSAARYETMAELARRSADLSSAWICELNRSEEQDLVVELSRLAGPRAQPLFEGRPKG